jgi:hypothetical protein
VALDWVRPYTPSINPMKFTVVPTLIPVLDHGTQESPGIPKAYLTYRIILIVFIKLKHILRSTPIMVRKFHDTFNNVNGNFQPM